MFETKVFHTSIYTLSLFFNTHISFESHTSKIIISVLQNTQIFKGQFSHYGLMRFVIAQLSWMLWVPLIHVLPRIYELGLNMKSHIYCCRYKRIHVITPARTCKIENITNICPHEFNSFHSIQPVCICICFYKYCYLYLTLTEIKLHSDVIMNYNRMWVHIQ